MSKNIVETIIPAPPNDYEAYLYKWTNLDNARMYVGWHKGSVNDDYSHSSSDDEFADVFEDSESKLKFEVMQYGSAKEIQNSEATYLRRVNAAKNPQYYNKWNGFVEYEEPDLEKCQQLVQQIQDGIYPIQQELIKDHIGMEYLQVREKHDDELQREIRDKINDALGNTEKCNPVIIFAERTANGADLRVDGNHTVFGSAQAKHARYIPVITIPANVAAEFNETEIRTIANLLNKKPDVTKKPVSDEDAIKYVITNADKGIPYNSQVNITALESFGFAKKKITTILKKAKKELDDREDKRSGQLFINYSAYPDKTTLLNRTKRFAAKDNTCSVYMSSRKFSIERILEELYAGKQDNVKHCVVVIHHPDKDAAKHWKKSVQPTWLDIIDHMNMEEWSITFEEMDTHKPDPDFNED